MDFGTNVPKEREFFRFLPRFEFEGDGSKSGLKINAADRGRGRDARDESLELALALVVLFVEGVRRKNDGPLRFLVVAFEEPPRSRD